MNFRRNPAGSPLRRALLGTLAALLLTGGAPVCAQQQPRPGGTIRVDVNLVLLEATVKNKSGQVMDGLTKDDFILEEDGVPQKIAHFSRDRLPLAVALVVDLSASIGPFLRPLRYASESALKALKPEDEVALFTFSGRVERRVDLTRDKREAAGQIQTFSSAGSTNINGAIYEAAQYLQQAAPNGRRVIVLVSDNVGTDTGGVGARDVIAKALEADTAVYDLKIPGDNPLSSRMAAMSIRGRVNVKDLTEQTGGEIFDVEKIGSLYLAFEALIQRLKTRYTLGYYPARTKDKRGFRKLELRLAPSFGSEGRDYLVIAKHGYYAQQKSPGD